MHYNRILSITVTSNAVIFPITIDVYQPAYGYQMHLQAVSHGPGGTDLHKTRVDMRLKVYAYGSHVPDYLAWRLFEREVQATLSSIAGSSRELGCKTSLACACRSGNQYGGAAIVALTSKHCIQALYARRYSL